MKQHLIVAAICLVGTVGAILLQHQFADKTSTSALAMIIALWLALTIAAVIAFLHASRADKAEKRAQTAEEALANYDADYESLDNFIIRIYMVCFSASQGVGHYYRWKDEFLAVNFGRKNVLRCLQSGAVPPVPDALALDEKQLATLTQLVERSHFVQSV